MNQILKSVSTLAAASIIFGLLAGAANAAITLSIYQDGSKVSISTTGGTLDTTGLTSFLTTGSPGNILHGFSNVVGFHQSLDSIKGFDGGSLSTTGGFSYGNGGMTSAVFTGSYNVFALRIAENGFLYLETSAISGINIVSAVTATTVADSTLAELGFVEGSTATFAWSADNVTVQVIPEPSSALLLGIGALFLAANHHRKQ